MFNLNNKNNFNLKKSYNDYLLIKNKIDYDFLVFFIDKFIDYCFNINNLSNKHNKLGRPPYSHKMLIKVIILGYCYNIYSGRKIEKCLKNNIHFIRLSNNATPCYKVINNFKKDYDYKITTIFAELVKTLKNNGYVNLKAIGTDGTKIRANASKSNVLYQHEIVQLKKILDHNIILQLTRRYEKYVENNNTRGVEKLNRRANNFIKHYWEKINKNKPKKEQKRLRKATINFLKKSMKSTKTLEKGKNELIQLENMLNNTTQKSISISDPESKWMPNKNGGTDLNYNIQVTTDIQNNLIINIDAITEINDVTSLIPQIEKIQEITESNLKNTILLADNGYYNESNITYLIKQDITPLIPTKKQAQHNKNKNKNKKKPKPYSKAYFKKNSKEDFYICPENQILLYKNTYKIQGTIKRVYYTLNCKHCKAKDKCAKKSAYKQITENTTENKEKIQKLFEKEENKELYKKRNTVEIIFAIIKHNMKYRQTKTFGLASMKTECNLLAISINMMKTIDILTTEE